MPVPPSADSPEPLSPPQRIPFELRHLTYFEAVARLGSISKASLELSVTQPAITMQLQDLAEALQGGPLFEKVGRRLRLTSTGEVFRERAQEILRRVGAVQAEMRERGHLHGGRVSIGAPASVGACLLPEVLGAFHHTYPELELRVYEGNTPSLMGLLGSGEIDLAIVTLPISERSLEVTPLFSERLVVVVHQAHRLAGLDPIQMAELRDEAFLLYSPGGFVRDATLRACRRAGFVPKVVLDSGSMELLLRMAEASLGVTVLPPLAIKGRPQLKGLELISETDLSRTMALISRQGRELTPAARRLREFLVDALDRRPAGT